ncbi:hypothetical protein C8Q69DRAFT_494996 [Paecilomyces variotii]|uniref:Uncharacterized protein n=1 Tax=Byssochlamys spectabilis TaxID=264951 RepID=A0A443I6F6_BYSSP|nr:hypothetical protein C8Q69DRAFT_494996 [Paecilomyces variotii]RWQ99683.1 hypothetical protein C8Q69DRAFT_494996 [Paecilomyces variotii]
MATAHPILCQTAAEWREEVRERNLQGKSLAVSPNNLQSGSRVTEEQFLLFRTLFPPTRECFDANLFGLSVEYQQAGVLLLGSADFQAYLQRISGGATSLSQWHQDTLFKVPLAQQQQAFLSGGSKLTRRSESVVNASIISYLQALSMVATPISGEWSANRIPLEADFGSGRKFTAVTDGQLQEVTTKHILALVECKRDERLRHSPQVEFQETAQMVAWIREFPDAAPRPWTDPNYTFASLNTAEAGKVISMELLFFVVISVVRCIITGSIRRVMPGRLLNSTPAQRGAHYLLGTVRN